MRCAHVSFWRALLGQHRAIKLHSVFYELPKKVRLAVYFHEVGHIKNKHIYKRIYWTITLKSILFFEKYCALLREQELEADAYSVRKGYAEGLKIFLTEYCHENTGYGYPSLKERLLNIQCLERKKNG